MTNDQCLEPGVADRGQTGVPSGVSRRVYKPRTREHWSLVIGHWSFRPLVFFCALTLAIASPARADVRLKDITDIEGARSNQLYGLGLVVGLNGTGARQQSLATRQLAIDMLRKLNVVTKIARQDLEDNVFQSDSIAAVMVTAELPPFAREGSRIDVVVSVIDTARSLEGGTLLLTPLQGADGEVYGVAQGPVSVGGFDLSLLPQIGGLRNHPTVGRIARGAIVEREALGELQHDGHVRFLLHQPDYATAKLVADAINTRFDFGTPTAPPGVPPAITLLRKDTNGVVTRQVSTHVEPEWPFPPPKAAGPLGLPDIPQEIARTLDAGTIEVLIPPKYMRDVVTFISEIGELEIIPDTEARVVINERTGTIVVGQDVKISTVAIAHGNLVIRPIGPATPPQPGPAAQALLGLPPTPAPPPFPGGAFFPGAIVEGDKLNVVRRSFTVAELARALNSLGVLPRDLIAIFQALQESGALHAKLVIM
ncbi:MAG: flagellar basal body P-ring protein FlgI [Planctomycetes bacterium]|nr:flagellar basal body P-ring protein FlgI [Planctomycetota bacterium]